MKTIFIGLCLLFFYNSISQAQTYQWVKGGGTTTATSSTAGSPDEAAIYSCTDPHGNIYSLNYVAYGAITADTFHASTSYSVPANILITSYNCNGQMRWAKLIASTFANCTSYGLVADSLGHIYLSGDFPHSGSNLYIGYDTSIYGSYLTSAVIQLDTDGHFNWIRFIGQNTFAGEVATATGYGAVALDNQQNFHVIKYFGPGSDITSSITSHLGTYDLTYNSAGTLTNVKELNLDTTLYVAGAVIDTSTGKLFVYGDHSAAFTSVSYYPYIAALDSARNLIWLDTLGTESGFSGSSGFTGIGTDNKGCLYLCGSGEFDLTYRGDTICSPPTSWFYGSFIMKTDTSGALIWTKQYYASYTGNFYGITCMPNNKIGAVGIFQGFLNCGTDTLYSGAGRQDPFFSVVDTGGNLITLRDIHGDGDFNFGTTIASDKVGNLYIGGAVSDSIPTTIIPAYHSVGGTTDFFVLKYGIDCSCTSMPVANATDTGDHTVGFTYTGTTSGVDSFRWEFGDGGTSTATNPAHTYTAAGTYTITVTAYSFCGDDIHFSTVYIPCVAPPAAGLTTIGTTATRNFHYSGTGTAIDSIVWHFSDGGHDTGGTTSHTFTATGTYTVCVIANNPCGIDSTCSILTIPCLTAPTAVYTESGATATRHFNYVGTTTGVDSIIWHFGDGMSDTGMTASHTYTDTGTFTACVIAYSPCGSDTSCYPIIIHCITVPLASFTTTGSTAIRGFAYSGTATGLDSVVWHFGDGSHRTGLTTSHTYSDTGTFTVCVIAYNPCGSDSACSTITISCISAPVANFIDTGTAPVHFTYTGTTTGIDSIAWIYGDGSRGAGLTTTHTYTDIGTFTVCVIAYNNCGNDTVCHAVIIPCDTPVASFTHSGTVSVNFDYTGTSTGIDSVVWLYGDGNRGTGNTSTHSYSVSGTYHVCVIAYTNCAIDSICSDITVTGTFVYSPLQNSVQVFPNPATDEITITGITQSTTYQLLSITSACLQQGILQQGSNTVLMKNFATGIYILELTATDCSKNILKIIKE